MKFYPLSGIAMPHSLTRKKIGRIVKLTFILLTVFFLHVSATTLAQQVTLKNDRITLKNAFSEIRKQTGFIVLYKTDEVDVSKTVSLSLDHTELKEAMIKILENQNLEFTIEDQSIVIKKKEISSTDELKAQVRLEMAQLTVTGKVTNELGEPMSGVTIRQKSNSQNGTMTDTKGNYSITVPDDKTLIVFSYIGYDTQELQAKDIPAGSVVKLKVAENNLHEVVIKKGYYNEKKEFSTGDVSSITAKQIEETPASDPIMSLEGRIPGMQITQTSGMPGSDFTIFIRGQNSITNGNYPLYIVDGVPFNSFSLTSPDIGGGAVGLPSNSGNPYSPNGMGSGLSPFNNLNPDDIESIDVLRDADATAIYGSRGANGVVLITTKKGKPGQTIVDVNLNSGEGKVDRMIPMLNTQQYLEMRHEGFRNDGVLPGPNDYDVNGTWDTTRNINWEKFLIGNTAHFTNADFNVSGGNTNTQFIFGGAYSNQTTVFPGDYSDQKSSAHMSITHTSSNQKFHSSISAQYLQDNNVLPPIDFTGLIYQLAPDAPALYGANGNLNWENGIFSNPLGNAQQRYTSVSNSLVGTTQLSYEITPSLKLLTNAGYSRSEMTQAQLVPATAYYISPGQDPTYSRSTTIANSYQDTWSIEPQLNYQHKISSGILNVLFGSSIQRTLYSTNSFIGVGFTSDALLSNSANAAAIYSQGSHYTDYRYAGIYGRLNYIWQDKYIINFTGRRDGSSNFGPGKQYGDFGAIGTAWLFYKEKFIADALPFLSFGKLRASYGTTGNDQITPYQYLSTYNVTGNYQGTATLIPSQIANPNFAWEVDKKLEGGVELGILQNKINLEIDYYRNRSGNQLVGQPLPSQDGFSSVQANLPAVVQNTGLELQLNTVNFKSNNSSFSWSTSVNLTVPRNELVSFPNLAYNSSYSGTYVVGEPIQGVQKLYHYTGVDPQTGLSTFEDVNNDGKLTNADKKLVFIGQKYYGGLSNSFSYKGFQLDVLLQYAKQTGRNYLAYIYNTPGGGPANQTDYVLNRWQRPDDIVQLQKFTTGQGAAGGVASTAWRNLSSSDATVSDASFIRLKNVALSYTIPKSLQKTLGMQSARVYVQAQNLLTFTGYQGFDPESQGINLPPLRMISLGIRASF